MIFISVLNSISLFLGWINIAIIISFIATTIFVVIDNMIHDIKTRKTVIKKGTIMFLDDKKTKKIRIKKDLVLRFKKKKALVCTCEDLNYMVEGYSFNNFKDMAQCEFEHNLLKAYEKNKYYMRNIIEEID